MTGNVDDHNRNFSFIMGKDGCWHAAPTYDFTFSITVDAPKYMNRHSMTINGSDDDINKGDLLALAETSGIRNPEGIIAKVIEVAKEYRRFGEASGVPNEWISTIEDEISQRTETLEESRH